MAIKQKLLEVLEQNRGQYQSGQGLAKQLQVSRSAIWKAINQLRQDGFVIKAKTNRGYALALENDRLSQAGIEKYLWSVGLRLELYQQVTSTNRVLKDRAQEAEGLVIVANQQTDGMGRQGRSFYSPKESGIYFSLLLKPDMIGSEATFLTTMAAVAVCQAIEKVTDKKPQIKWVNDIYIEGKKVCGILTQAAFNLETGRADYVIVGIGINVYRPAGGFPSDLSSIAGAVLAQSTGEMRNQLLAEILNCFWAMYQRPEQSEIAGQYKGYSLVIGRRVEVLSNRGTRSALVLDIDPSCNLVVRYEDGQTEVLSSGEIRIKL